MKAGKLDREITIQQPSGSPPDAAGEPNGNWVNVAENEPATVTQIGGRDIFAGGVTPIADTTFTIRWMDGIKSYMRVLYEGDVYEIIGKPKELGRREGLEIVAKAILKGQ